MLFAGGTISPTICPIDGPTEGRHDKARRKTRQDKKSRGQAHRRSTLTLHYIPERSENFPTRSCVGLGQECEVKNISTVVPNLGQDFVCSPSRRRGFDALRRTSKTKVQNQRQLLTYSKTKNTVQQNTNVTKKNT